MALIELNRISKQFHGQPVLQDISLRVEKGTVTTLIGPSGAGKSTLLRCINLLEQPDSGTLQLGGEAFTFPAKHSSDKILSLRKKTSMVFQQFNLWPHKTVLENVMLAPIVVLKQTRHFAEKQALILLKQMELADKAHAYPGTLSGGQQQRVGIARALAMEPEVLLFDEPTASLDPEKVKDILSIMQRLATLKKTMLVVTHEMNFARHVADRVIFLENGRVVIDDDSDAIFQQNKYTRLTQFIHSIDPTEGVNP